MCYACPSILIHACSSILIHPSCLAPSLNTTNLAFLSLPQELWTLLSHLTLPLALFYRFHSSVCLADMWKASYEAEEAH